MKTNSFKWNLPFAPVLAVLGFGMLFIQSCATPPPPEPIRVEQMEAVEDDIWALLEKGEFSKARGYFLGRNSVNDTDIRGRTPLHLAAEISSPDMAAFFIALGADANAIDRRNRSPLSISTDLQDSAVAQILVAAGADIHFPMEEDNSPARQAVNSGDVSFLEAILTPKSAVSVDGEGRNILHIAVLEGAVDALPSILETANTLRVKDRAGKTALDLALDRPDSEIHIEVAEKLILAGAVSANPIYTYLAPAVRSSNYNTRIGDGIAPLHFAAGQGYLGLAQYLIDKEADINVKTTSGTTPLQEAARYGHIDVMELLIENGVDVDAQDNKGNTAMHTGMPVDRNAEAINLLIVNGANPNLRDEYGESPLHIAVTLGRNRVVIDTLLEGGADVSMRNSEGKTPLYIAVEENRADAIPALLEYNSDLFAADNAGITPIELALRDNLPVMSSLITAHTVLQSDSAGNTPLIIGVKVNASPAIIGLILDNRALVNARNQEGDTALHIAVRQDEKETGELLLSRSADIFAPNAKGESPLYLAFSSTGKPRNNPGKLREWVFNAATVQAKDGGGNTALHYAALWKMDAHIPFIVQQGADPNSPNAIREPPLFMAVRVDSPSTVMTLISQGAVIDNRDSQGNSCLHAAVRWNAPGAAETLIAQGAAINAHALNGKTPLHDAVRMGQAGMESLLIKNGASLEVRDNEGNTPFMEAVIAGYPAAVERLAELGADPNTRNSRGDTPLHSAVAQSRIDIVSLLLGWGAQIHAKNIVGRSPFQTALITSPQMVSALLTKDRIPASDDDGRSPLHIALLEGKDQDIPVSILKLIVDLGGRVQVVDADGRTPLRLAADLEKWDHAKFLTDANSNVFSVAGDGKTPAEVALGKGREAVTALFSGRAITARDATGNTVLHYAAHVAGPEVISLLIELGANKTAKNISSESPIDVALKWKRPSSVTTILN
jgi:ankyrin repeat protein